MIRSLAIFRALLACALFACPAFSQQLINTTPGAADTAPQGAAKINSNFQALWPLLSAPANNPQPPGSVLCTPSTNSGPQAAVGCTQIPATALPTQPPGTVLSNVGNAQAPPIANNLQSVWNFGPSTPATNMTATATTGGSLSISSSYFYTVTFVDAFGESDYNTSALPCVTLNASQNAVSLSAIPVDPSGLSTARRIYRTPGLINCSQDPRGGWTTTANAVPSSASGQSVTYELVATISDNTTTTFTDTAADSALTATYPPGVSTAITNWSRTSDANPVIVAPYGNSVAVGLNSIPSHSCYSCVAIGNSTLFSSQSVSRSVAIGQYALYASASGSANTAVGIHALGALVGGVGYTAFGFGALQNEATTGSASTAVGFEALLNENNATASNVAVGYGALELTSSGNKNAALGFEAGLLNTSGGQNTLVGYLADYIDNGGSFNTFVGSLSANVHTSGSGNTSIGQQTFFTLTTGANNTAMGVGVASTVLTTGGSNILIGTSSATTTVGSNTFNEVNIGTALMGYDSISGISVTSGGGTSPAVTGNGTFLFWVTEGASGTPSATLVLAMPTATNDWACDALDRTSTTITARQTGAASATAATITFSSAPANSDRIQVKCLMQ